MMKSLKTLEDEIASWPHISVHPHRFAAKEFLVGNAEVGHVHQGGIVDIPFPRSWRDALLAQGLAEEHRCVPNSGWAIRSGSPQYRAFSAPRRLLGHRGPLRKGRSHSLCARSRLG